MARNKFGGTNADGVFTRVGGLLALAPAQTLTMWTAETGGTQVTDLLDKDGLAVTTIRTEPGHVPVFFGPDGVTELWADDGDSQRALMVAQGRQGPEGPVGPPGGSDASFSGWIEDTTSATRASLNATFVPRTGANKDEFRLESSTNGEHPLTVHADKGDGGGMLERFTVENTAGGGGCDVNFRNVDVNISTWQAGAYPTHMKFYGPPSTSVDTLRIYKAGSSTDLVSKLTNAGTFVSYAKGNASGAAFSLAAWGDANQTFAIGAPDGKLQWGPGGATALDTSLYREAAGVLRTDGKVRATSLQATTGNLSLIDSGGSTGLQVRTGDVTFSKRVLFLGDASSVTFPDGAGVVAGSTTGLKIGTAATQKLGFYGAAPVVRPAGVTVDAAGIHAALVSLGLISA